MIQHSLYPGRSLTFKVLYANQYLYRYINLLGQGYEGRLQENRIS
jgi:hypothetical protein